jgi:transcriptional regulator GlxA family with amidase domain
MFRRRFSRVRLAPDTVLTADSGLIRTAAAAVFFQLALHPIAKFGSPDLARSSARALLVDPDRGSQLRMSFWIFHGNTGMPAFGRPAGRGLTDGGRFPGLRGRACATRA